MKLTLTRSLLLLTLLTACSALSSGPLGTATPPPPTSTPVLSPTPIWFPATDTPTPQALTTPTATPNWHPGLGAPIKVDDFSDAAQWEVRSADEGSVSLLKNQLIISASPGDLFTSRNEKLALTDFYAEVTASLNICSGADEYGLLVRATSTAAYRFTLTCDGQVHAERVRKDERLVLQKPFRSGDAPRGAPSQVQLAVWVFKTDMRFFLNGNFQFEVSDANLPSGSLGFFVNSAGATPIIVAFSDLSIQKLDYSPVAAP